LELNPPFYLAHGIRDVIVVNPYTGQVYHFRSEGVIRSLSPSAISLECGCLLDA
jgi:hypothetical protein